MTWLVFSLSALVVILAAMKLAEYGDVIAVRTSLGGMFVGTLLLAGATSLPELLTTINSINQAVPSLAAGNIFGSCMFNMFMLAILDLVVRQTRILRAVQLNHAISGSLAVLLAALAIFFILADLPYRLGWVGVDSLLLMAVYIGGVWVLNSNNVGNTDEEQSPDDLRGMPSLRTGLLGFALATLALIVVTPFLVRSSAEIAVLLGVSAGFIGAALVAVITSLPELVTTIAAVRIGAYDLAIGNLFGSNCFNIFALAITDIFYTQGRFLGAITPVMTIAALLGLLLTSMGLFGNVARIERRLGFIEIDALIIAVTYVAGMWLLYSRGLVA